MGWIEKVHVHRCEFPASGFDFWRLDEVAGSKWRCDKCAEVWLVQLDSRGAYWQNINFLEEA